MRRGVPGAFSGRSGLNASSSKMPGTGSGRPGLCSITYRARREDGAYVAVMLTGRLVAGLMPVTVTEPAIWPSVWVVDRNMQAPL
jgi:hypothetical protein